MKVCSIILMIPNVFWIERIMASRSTDSIGELILLIDRRECHGRNGDVGHSLSNVSTFKVQYNIFI